MSNAIDAMVTASATHLSLAKAGFMRAGRGIKGLLKPLSKRDHPLDENVPADAVQLSNMELGDLSQQRVANRQLRRTSAESLGSVQSRIEKMRKGGVTKEEQPDYEALLNERQKLVETINKSDSDYATNMQRRNEVLKKRFESQTAQALQSANDKLAKIDFFQGWADAIGAGSNKQMALSQSRSGALEEKRLATIEQAKKAFAAGYTDMGNSLMKDAGDLFNQVTAENTKQKQLLIQNINDEANNRNRLLDLRGRGADVQALVDAVRV